MHASASFGMYDPQWGEDNSDSPQLTPGPWKQYKQAISNRITDVCERSALINGNHNGTPPAVQCGTYNTSFDFEPLPSIDMVHTVHSLPFISILLTLPSVLLVTLPLHHEVRFSSLPFFLRYRACYWHRHCSYDILGPWFPLARR
jgi:hypothetical protein